VSQPPHSLLRQLLSGLGRPVGAPGAGHLSDAAVGELVTGRASSDAAEQQRAHLDVCLPCLKRFTALQSALAATPAPARFAKPTPPLASLRADVDQAVEETGRARAKLSALGARRVESQEPTAYQRRSSAASPSLMDVRVVQANIDNSDSLLTS